MNTETAKKDVAFLCISWRQGRLTREGVKSALHGLSLRADRMVGADGAFAVYANAYKKLGF
jgi:hypothetical protein